jgi:hypothetical protein
VIKLIKNIKFIKIPPKKLKKKLSKITHDLFLHSFISIINLLSINTFINFFIYLINLQYIQQIYYILILPFTSILFNNDDKISKINKKLIFY